MKKKMFFAIGIITMGFSLTAFIPTPAPLPSQCIEWMFDWTYDEYVTGECFYNNVKEGNTTACDLDEPGDRCDHWECDTEWPGCTFTPAPKPD